MPNAPDVFRSNDVALLEISTALILNAILKHLLKWTFRVFPVKFDLQVIIVIVVVIIYFLNSNQCVKCWTLLGLFSTGGLRSEKSTRFSIFLTACCWIHELRSAAYLRGWSHRKWVGNPAFWGSLSYSVRILLQWDESAQSLLELFLNRLLHSAACWRAFHVTCI